MFSTKNVSRSDYRFETQLIFERNFQRCYVSASVNIRTKSIYDYIIDTYNNVIKTRSEEIQVKDLQSLFGPKEILCRVKEEHFKVLDHIATSLGYKVVD